MQTLWDWLSLAVFAGLAVLYLQRSMAASDEQDRIIDYLPPSIACALSNYAGNHDHPILAAILILAAIAHILLILKPFPVQRG